MFNMTKYLDYAILSVAILAILPSCTSENDNPNPVNEVRFLASTDDTRASLVTSTSLKSFAVYGNMVSSSSPSSPAVVFDGTTVNNIDGKWTYDNVQYWLPGKTYSFAAIHIPSDDNISDLTYSNDKLSFNYVAPVDYNRATDIITAAHRRAYSYSATSSASPVYFDFGHIMSRINFVAKVDPVAVGTEITINKIEIRGLSSRASYSLQPGSLNGSTETYDLVGNAWTVSTQDADKITITKEFISDNTITTGESIEFFPVDDPLLLIPQSITNITLVLTYTRNGITSQLTGSLNSTGSSYGYAWSANQSYRYTFTIGSDEYLIFSKPVVSAWDEDEGGNYIIIG